MTDKEIKNSSKLKTQLDKENNQKNKSHKYYMSAEKYEKVLDEMISKYPELFSKKEPKLFKIGIKKDIIGKGGLSITNTQLAKFLRMYCSSKGYRKLHIENAKRYDLAGKESGIVTKEHVEALLRKKEEARKKRELNKQKKKEHAKKTAADAGNTKPNDSSRVRLGVKNKELAMRRSRNAF